MDELFRQVFEPNPSLVSDPPGASGPPDSDGPVPVAMDLSGYTVRFEVTRLWVDAEGKTWAEGVVPAGTPPVPMGHQHQPVRGLPWDHPNADPLGDIEATAKRMREIGLADPDGRICVDVPKGKKP